METIDKRTKEYRDTVRGESGQTPKLQEEVFYRKDQFAKAQDNPGFHRCMHCGADLPPNEDGSAKWRRFPEPCDKCIRRNK